MSIVYRHERNISLNKFGEHCIDALGGTTIAMESLKPWILDTLEVGNFFEKKIGVAKCSKEDRYNKKSGRELASSRMKLVKLTVSYILKTADRTTLSLVDDNGTSYLFIKYKTASEPFFVGYYK
jgi:hypothetical protein